MTFLKSSVKTEYFETENQLINCAKRLENNSSVRMVNKTI